MKKHHKVLIISVICSIVIAGSLLFFIFSSKGTTTEKEVSKVSDYPTIEELEKKLGSPAEIMDHKEEVLGAFNSIDKGNYSNDRETYDSAKIELESSDSVKLIKYKDKSTRDYFEYYYSDDTFVYSIYNLK
ncbi:TPA: hypothetical protein IQZ07_000610 [Listeria monocytogenes]|nr:hypothetical protein [Listeria monocytogenes]